MISFNSIKNFFITNIFLLMISLIEYLFMSSDNILIWYLILTIKNYLLIYIIDSRQKNFALIQKDQNQPKESYYFEFDLYLLSSTLVDTITLYIIKKYLFEFQYSNIFSDMLYFIPLSFMFEIVFDFFHYWGHRILHKNKYLYYYLHKTHHKFKNPIPILTFYQNPIDLLISYSIPNILGLYFVSYFFNISLFQFIMMMVYKVYVEIAGHCGKNPKPSSFVQFMWLPRLLNIELYTVDHDAYHSLNNCNYSKRFSLWDKVFGTIIYTRV